MSRAADQAIRRPIVFPARLRPSDQVSLDSFYATRFPEEDRAAKDAIWQVLCARFFQRYVRPDDVVVDIGPGLGEFLRHIKCGTRIAVDIEHLTGRTLPPGTREVLAPSHELASHIAAGSVDVVFCSNFFEHLPDKATFLATLRQILTVLKPGGRLLALQPNIRFVGGAYWDPVDHHLPLTHVTLIEASQSVGFEVEEVVPRFLPYTTRSAIPQSPWLVRLYLAVRPIWRVMGQQTWFVARKPNTSGVTGWTPRRPRRGRCRMAEEWRLAVVHLSGS